MSLPEGSLGIAVGHRYPTTQGGFILLTDDAGKTWVEIEADVPILQSADVVDGTWWVAGDAWMGKGGFLAPVMSPPSRGQSVSEDVSAQRGGSPPNPPFQTKAHQSSGITVHRDDGCRILDPQQPTTHSTIWAEKLLAGTENGSGSAKPLSGAPRARSTDALK
ncbi:MAG: hypothetical protein ACI8RZ_001035 [Myxococcota bacterium]